LRLTFNYASPLVPSFTVLETNLSAASSLASWSRAVFGPSRYYYYDHHGQVVMTQIPGINRIVNCGRQNQMLGMRMSQDRKGVSMALIATVLRAELPLL